MNKTTAEMFRYNAWANRRLLEALRGLSAEQLETHVPGTSGPVREILTHIVGAQQTFVLRTKGRQHEGELSRESPWPGIDGLLEIVESTDAELLAIAEQIDDEEEVDLPYMGVSYRFPKRFFLVHTMQHSVEHRSEVKVALAQLGVDTPDLDAWEYATEMGYGEPV